MDHGVYETLARLLGLRIPERKPRHQTTVVQSGPCSLFGRLCWRRRFLLLALGLEHVVCDRHLRDSTAEDENRERWRAESKRSSWGEA